MAYRYFKPKHMLLAYIIVGMAYLIVILVSELA
jgi:hypothetical protein